MDPKFMGFIRAVDDMGRITIPSEIRDAIGLKLRGEVDCQPYEGGVFIQPIVSKEGIIFQLKKATAHIKTLEGRTAGRPVCQEELAEILRVAEQVVRAVEARIE